MEDHVTVGAWATVQEDGGEHVYRVMPALEADPMRSWISEESPLGRALLDLCQQASEGAIELRASARRAPGDALVKIVQGLFPEFFQINQFENHADILAGPNRKINPQTARTWQCLALRRRPDFRLYNPERNGAAASPFGSLASPFRDLRSQPGN